jgi:transposase
MLKIDVMGDKMFIKLSKSGNFQNVYLVEGYRDKDGKVKHRTIKKYGLLHELEAQDPDILEKLKHAAKTLDNDEIGNLINLSINLASSNDQASNPLNYGHFFLEGIYNSLNIDDFIKKESSKYKFEYDFNEILKLLVISRILNPASKKETYENKYKYFHDFNFSLDDLYRSLDVVDDIKVDLQLKLHSEISKHYNRDCTLVFYDVTNYYFETEDEDELRANGVSKENRKTPIVQMGLFIDRNGIPIAYRLFRGNNHDKTTLIPILNDMKEQFNLGRIIVTADKGLNSGKNLAFITKKKNGYIVSQQIRGSKKEFINYVLDDTDYVYNEKRTFKMKSFIRERDVKDEDGNLVQLKEKVLCFWSKDYADREEHKRGDIEELIQSFLDNPSKYKASNKFGVKKYLKELEIDEETGEVKKSETKLYLDKEKYEKDKALDGYYSIITSETQLEEEAIIEKYRGLWRIEDSFRVIKSDLEGRPVYVWTKKHIEAHFLTCFLALTISRILQYKLNYKYTVKEIIESLNGANCKLINQNIYSLEKHNEVYKGIERLFDVSLDKANVRLETLRCYGKKIFEYNKK